MIGTKSREIQKAPGNSDYCLIDGALHRDRKKGKQTHKSVCFCYSARITQKRKEICSLPLYWVTGSNGRKAEEKEDWNITKK